MKRTTYWLYGILLLAFLVRVWGVGNQDMLGDESADAFRSIGYIDYLGTEFQTQPVVWYKNTTLPQWTSLSFHDAPPLGFLIQHITFALFGDSLLTARLPAILLGTGAVYLIYLITRRLWNETAGLGAAFWYAIAGGSVWIFRTSLLEPLLIFFILLNIYIFLRFLEDRRWWWLFGLSLGAIALTKYTGVFLIPVYGIYTLLVRRTVWRDWRWYTSFGVALLVFSPVLIYNFYLYQAVHHFDLQLAYLLGQDVSREWTGLLGKIQDPFSRIWVNLIATYGWISVVGILTAIAYGIGYLLKRKEWQLALPILYLVWVTAILYFIGSAPRFLSLYGPASAILIGWAVARLLEMRIRTGRIVLISVVALLCYGEIVFMFQKVFVTYPNYGVAALDNYFNQEFKGKESAVTPQTENPHLNEVINRFAEKKVKGPRMFSMIIYDDVIALPTLEWIFYRRFFYHSIPTMYIENFQATLNREGSNYFKNFTLYFVESTEHTLLNQIKAGKPIGAAMEKGLQQSGFQPVRHIYGHDHQEMFRVYKFTI